MCSVCSCPHSAAAYCQSSTLCVSYCSKSKLFIKRRISLSRPFPRTTPRRFCQGGSQVTSPAVPPCRRLCSASPGGSGALPGARCMPPLCKQALQYGLHAHGYALAIHLVTDVYLQASHLHITTRVFARRLAALLSTQQLGAAIFHKLSVSRQAIETATLLLLQKQQPADTCAGLSGSAAVIPDGTAGSHLRSAQPSDCACHS